MNQAVGALGGLSIDEGGVLQSDFWWHHEAASEELALECFVSLLSHIQQRVEFRLIS
jgi:hypothetical protein